MWNQDKVNKNLARLQFPSVGDELGFTWRPCWLCERELGGNRHELRYVDEDTEIYHEEICDDCVQYVVNGELPIR